MQMYCRSLTSNLGRHVEIFLMQIEDDIVSDIDDIAAKVDWSA